MVSRKDLNGNKVHVLLNAIGGGFFNAMCGRLLNTSIRGGNRQGNNEAGGGVAGDTARDKDKQESKSRGP